MATRRDFITRVAQAGRFGAAFTTMRAMGLVAAEAGIGPVQLPPRSGTGTHVVVLGAGKVPWNAGSWVSLSSKPDVPPYYSGLYRQLLDPDGRIFFAGDHMTRLVAWQEGAALSAHRAIAQLVDHRRAAPTVSRPQPPLDQHDSPSLSYLMS